MPVDFTAVGQIRSCRTQFQGCPDQSRHRIITLSEFICNQSGSYLGIEHSARHVRQKLKGKDSNCEPKNHQHINASLHQISDYGVFFNKNF